MPYFETREHRTRIHHSGGRDLMDPTVAEASLHFLDKLDMSAKEQGRIAIKNCRRILLLEMADIIAIEARGNYAVLHRPSGSLLVRESISTVEKKLSSYGFVRIHRSLVVNSAWVEGIDPNSTGDYVLRVKGGKQYAVSRVYKRNLHLLAQSWIGTNGFLEE